MIKIPLLDDALKGLPDNARLRSDITTYLKRIGELEAEVASLKDDKRLLQRRLEELDPKDAPDDEDALLLKLIAEYGSASVATLTAALQEVHPLHHQVIQLKLSELSKRGYVRGDAVSAFGERGYRLRDKATRFLIETGLLDNKSR